MNNQIVVNANRNFDNRNFPENLVLASNCVDNSIIDQFRPDRKFLVAICINSYVLMGFRHQDPETFLEWTMIPGEYMVLPEVIISARSEAELALMVRVNYEIIDIDPDLPEFLSF